MTAPNSSSRPNPEAQRLFLLQTMGIRSYYPRLQLPGALPSVLADWAQDAGDEPEPAREVVREARIAVPPVIPMADTALASRPASDPPERPSAVQAAARVSPALQEAGHLAFQVLLIPADRGLLVCNQLPVLAQPGLDARERQLLDNILFWLGCKRHPEAVQRHFVWPLPGLGQTDAGMAGKTLQGFLAQAQQEAGFARLLMMGSNSVDCLQAQLAVGLPSWQTWYTHSLTELLAQPDLKRSAWEHLQTLQAGLR